MPEVLLEYRTEVVADGVVFRARACGAPARDRTRRWEGWIEFVPAVRRGATIRTGRETMQPNRMCLVYWATGLQPVFLEGALERARDRQPQAIAQANRESAVRPHPAPVPAHGTFLARDVDRSHRPRTLRLTRADRRFLRSLSISPR